MKYFLLSGILLTIPQLSLAHSHKTATRSTRTMRSLQSTPGTLPGVLPEHEETVVAMLADIQAAIEELSESLEHDLTPRLSTLIHRLLNFYAQLTPTQLQSFDHIDAREQQILLSEFTAEIAIQTKRYRSRGLNQVTMEKLMQANQHLHELLSPTLYPRASAWKQITRGRTARDKGLRIAIGVTAATAAAAAAGTIITGSSATISEPEVDPAPYQASPARAVITRTPTPIFPDSPLAANQKPPSPRAMFKARHKQRLLDQQLCDAPLALDHHNFHTLSESPLSDLALATEMQLPDDVARSLMTYYLQEMRKTFESEIDAARKVAPRQSAFRRVQHFETSLYHSLIAHSQLEQMPLHELAKLCATMSDYAHSLSPYTIRQLSQSTWGSQKHRNMLRTRIQNMKGQVAAFYALQNEHLGIAMRHELGNNKLQAARETYAAALGKANKLMAADILSDNTIAATYVLERQASEYDQFLKANAAMFNALPPSVGLSQVEWGDAHALNQRFTRERVTTTSTLVNAIERSGNEAFKLTTPAKKPWYACCAGPESATASPAGESPIFSHTNSKRTRAALRRRADATREPN